MTWIRMLVLWFCVGAQARTMEPFDALNHCTNANECLPTRMSDLACPTVCGRMGILINRAEKEAFKKMRAVAARGAICPDAKCSGPPVRPTECKFKCVRSKCWLDVGRSARGC